MYQLVNKQIKDTSPEKVYVFPEKLTQPEINMNVSKLHIIANEDSDRTLYCLFDNFEDKNRKFQVCFPLSHLDLKKYSLEDIQVLQRDKAVTAEYKGEFAYLSQAAHELIEYAKEAGYKVRPPYRYLFILHKKKLFSKKPQDFTMEIHLPVEKL